MLSGRWIAIHHNTTPHLPKGPAATPALFVFIWMRGSNGLLPFLYYQS
jgi:hypothetical protein